MRRFKAEFGPVPLPKDILITAHPKGRNRERLVTALHKIGAITTQQAREELGLIHTTPVRGKIPRSIDRRKATDPASQMAVEMGYFPGKIIGDSVVLGPKMPPNTHAQTYLRSGADLPGITTDVRRVRTQLDGRWKGTPLKIFSVEKGQLADSMHLKGAVAAVSHLSRGSKVHFRGFDEVVPVLSEAGLMKRIPASPSAYEKARALKNPFRRRLRKPLLAFSQ